MGQHKETLTEVLAEGGDKTAIEALAEMDASLGWDRMKNNAMWKGSEPASSVPIPRRRMSLRSPREGFNSPMLGSPVSSEDDLAMLDGKTALKRAVRLDTGALVSKR